MSAQEATSEITIKNVDGSDSQFRTITTHENGRVEKTVIQQSSFVLSLLKKKSY